MTLFQAPFFSFPIEQGRELPRTANAKTGWAASTTSMACGAAEALLDPCGGAEDQGAAPPLALPLPLEVGGPLAGLSSGEGGARGLARVGQRTTLPRPR